MSVNEAIIDSNNLKFNFKIEKFTDNLNEVWISEKVCFAQGRWNIHVDANKDKDFVGIHLHKSFVGSATVSFKASIIVKDKLIKSRSLVQTFESDVSAGWSKFMSRKDLIAKISPEFSFTVACEMKLVYVVKFHPSVKLKTSSQFRCVCTKDFEDLIIRVKDSDQILSIHRNIVAAYSPVLHKEILKLSGSDDLKIDDFSIEVVQEVINFIYDKKVNKTEENVKKILLASKKYQIPDLQTECKIYILRTLKVENAFETLIYAYDNLFLCMATEIIGFVDENIDILLKNQMDQWKQVVAEHPGIIKALFEKIMLSRLKKLKNCKSPPIKSAKIDESSSVDHNMLARDYENLYNSMDFSDVVFEVEEKTLEAHKCILISRSSVFKSMFENDNLESRKIRLEIADIKYETMKQLLQYTYCGKVSDLKDNAVNLFSAADKYDLLELKNVCRNSMEQNVTVDNVTEILKLSYLHSSHLTDLKELASSFFRKNFEVVFKSPKWSQFAFSNPRILSHMAIKFLGDLK